MSWPLSSSQFDPSWTFYRRQARRALACHIRIGTEWQEIASLRLCRGSATATPDEPFALRVWVHPSCDAARTHDHYVNNVGIYFGHGREGLPSGFIPTIHPGFPDLG